MAELDQDKAKDTLMGVLAYIDSPFKLFVVVLLAFLAFCGYFIYNNQATLIGAYDRSKTIARMDSGRYDDAARLLFKAANVDFVGIFEVDPIAGKRTLVRAYLPDLSRDKEVEGMKVPLFSKNEKNNEDTIALMAGKVPCSNYDYPQSEIGFWYVSHGFRYMCRISVPPDPNEFSGQITIGYKQKPKDDPINFLTIAADMLVKK